MNLNEIDMVANTLIATFLAYEEQANKRGNRTSAKQYKHLGLGVYALQSTLHEWSEEHHGNKQKAKVQGKHKASNAKSKARTNSRKRQANKK